MDCNKAIFLDRDGTINIEKEYLYKIAEFEYLPGAVKALDLFQKAGYLIIIITNQSGIARGYYTEEDYRILTSWMLEDLKKKGVEVSRVYYCPHHPSAKVEKYRMDCGCRKPKLGLYEQAVKDFELDLSACCAIGDKIRDCAVCNGSGCQGYLIGANEKPEIIEAVKDEMFKNIRYAKDLLSAAKMIIDC